MEGRLKEGSTVEDWGTPFREIDKEPSGERVRVSELMGGGEGGQGLVFEGGFITEDKVQFGDVREK